MTFHQEGPLGIVTLNRPEVLNAQGYEMLAQIDQGFDLARAEPEVRVVIVRGSGGVFSAGHDLSPDRQEAEDPLERYDQFKKYNLDLLLKWRNFPKPTVAMVEGYCIYAGWMLAACWTWSSPPMARSSWAGSSSTTPSPGTWVRRAKEVSSKAGSFPPRKAGRRAWSTGC